MERPLVILKTHENELLFGQYINRLLWYTSKLPVCLKNHNRIISPLCVAIVCKTPLFFSMFAMFDIQLRWVDIIIYSIPDDAKIVLHTCIISLVLIA